MRRLTKVLTRGTVRRNVPARVPVVVRATARARARVSKHGRKSANVCVNLHTGPVNLHMGQRGGFKQGLHGRGGDADERIEHAPEEGGAQMIGGIFELSSGRAA
eukprot:1194653-Prorocentrum_minimum.AAC.2